MLIVDTQSEEKKRKATKLQIDRNNYKKTKIFAVKVLVTRTYNKMDVDNIWKIVLVFMTYYNKKKGY